MAVAEEDTEGGRRKTLRERFEARTIKPRVKDVNAACWRYDGSHVHGVGSFRVTTGVTWRADAVAYSLSHGPWVPSMRLLHVCGQKWCVNPRHMTVARAPRRTPRVHSRYTRERKAELIRFCDPTALGLEETARTTNTPLSTLQRWLREQRRETMNGHAQEEVRARRRRGPPCRCRCWAIARVSKRSWPRFAA